MFGDRFTETSDSASLSWIEGSVQAQRGRRAGTGIRMTSESGEVLFRSVDGTTGRADPEPAECSAAAERASAERPATPNGRLAGRGGSRIETALEEDASRAIEFLEEAARWIEAEAGSGSGSGEGLRVQASVHLYSQQILHETAQRSAQDLRSGARIEIRAALRDGRPAERRIAARTITELLDRVCAREMGIDLGASLARRLEPFWAPRGPATVVFAAGSCGPLVHEIGHLFEEDRVGDAAQWLPVGGRIAPAGVTIIDDPLACAGRGSYAIDDEGERPTAALLVHEGSLAGRIRIAGAGATGHARRGSYRDLPLPRMACTVLSAGDDDAGEIVRSTREGIFVRSLRGGSADPFSGRITLTVDEAYRIEGGLLTSPVAECLLSGRALDLLGAVDAVGSDLLFDFGAGDCHKAGQPLPVITGMPTLRIRSVDVVAP